MEIILAGVNASICAPAATDGDFPVVDLAQQVLNGLLDGGEVARLALPAAVVGPVVSNSEEVVVDAKGDFRGEGRGK